MDKNLLIEYIPFSIPNELIKESLEKNNGRLFVSGLMQTSDSLNQNGRLYPESILKRECNKFQDSIRRNSSLGELDHPDTAVVNLQNTSHVIRELWWKGKDVYGKIEVLDTPSGKILKALFEAGILLGISSRGTGTVTRNEQKNCNIVNDDYELITWDFVSSPSTRGAWMLKESKESKLLLKNIIEKDIINKDKKIRDNRISELYNGISESVKNILNIYYQEKK